MRVRAIHQLLAGFTWGDAISNHAVEIQSRLRAWGYESRLLAVQRDPARPGCEDYRSYRGDRNSIVIYHYSIGSDATRQALSWPDRLVLYYHNITPAHFLHGYNAALERQLAQGRTELMQLQGVRHLAAVSEYNARDLAQLGFAPALIVPCFVNFDRLVSVGAAPAGRNPFNQVEGDIAINWLFVGRLVPNKRQDDLVRLFAYYQRWIRSEARLFLVGSAINAPLYQMQLEMLIERCQAHQVYLAGSVTDDELKAYYRTANVFVCLSEHEGFCVPLLEAMAANVPVAAYAAAAVPDTLGKAGILLREKRVEVMAEMIELLVSDNGLRRQVIARQQARLADFAPDRIEAQLRQLIDRVVAD